MNIIKLVSKLQRFFRPELKKNKAHAKELQNILDKLKKKQQALENEILLNQDPELIKLFQTELEIIRMQHQKGIAALHEIYQNIKSLS
ncbi:MAG: hypothetical protein Q7U98_02265 [Methylicorpusculum sp.]|uniref:hypothetical protein n=1 Tax=Methylicorpusculum sp. TaxID=2713644 RepID=UPI00271A2E54|nr:hypothetical protein [Methylicorpusculum sp.]MDO8845462.1 hypothetical protein [Methylicorpusculum sp.]MDO8937962.1 hypothetical protein [Methylicorpusculum sp.]MDP2177255.1 hypothetical protein [Methylicorpusculum sp.]MDP2201392.1 hypothetical protein [Methylicorpusculum sp.]MDP3531180.1 hypothetical protein [Methylicorpusculum sp.]